MEKAALHTHCLRRELAWAAEKYVSAVEGVPDNLHILTCKVVGPMPESNHISWCPRRLKALSMFADCIAQPFALIMAAATPQGRAAVATKKQYVDDIEPHALPASSGIPKEVSEGLQGQLGLALSLPPKFQRHLTKLVLDLSHY